MDEDEKIIEYNNVEYRYSSKWIYEQESLAHWELYWHQVAFINKFADSNDDILEIGPGSGFTTNYLRHKGFTVKTFDIDQEKKPDILGNIVAYPFTDKYDIITAFEVLEHIPYYEMENVLKKINRSCNKYFVLSVPMCKKLWFSLEVKSIFFQKKFFITTNRNRLGTLHHFWEIGYKEYSLKRFIQSIKNAGYSVIEKSRIKTHLFFILKPHN